MDDGNNNDGSSYSLAVEAQFKETGSYAEGKTLHNWKGYSVYIPDNCTSTTEVNVYYPGGGGTVDNGPINNYIKENPDYIQGSLILFLLILQRFF